MTCLVAGGSGFIGSHLCERLLRDEKDVICVDNLITGAKENITHLLSLPHFTFIEHDVTKEIPDDLLKNSKIDYIFHLASPASPNSKSPRSYISHPIETLLVNSIGTHNLLELAKKFTARFLYASSSEIYGDPSISPQREDYFGNVNPTGPRSVYDEGKRFGESITMAYVRKFALDGRIVRIFNTYGERMQADDGRVVSNFINQAIKNEPLTIYGDGKQTRSFCYVTDMIDGLYRAMFSEKAKGEVFNIGNSYEQTVLQLATIIKEMIHSSSKITFESLPTDDPKRRKPDIGKAKKLLDWEPQVSLNDGLKRTITYFKKIQ